MKNGAPHKPYWTGLFTLSALLILSQTTQAGQPGSWPEPLATSSTQHSSRYNQSSQPNGQNGSTIKLSPKVRIAPVVKRKTTDKNRWDEQVRRFLGYHSFILDEQDYQGHILAGLNQQETLATGDQVLIRSIKHVAAGTLLDIHRPGNQLIEPETNKVLGRLTRHIGSLRIIDHSESGPVAEVVKVYQEVEPGDQLRKPWVVNSDFNIQTHSGRDLEGKIIQVWEDLEEAGSGQVIVVSIGRQQQAIQGMTFTIIRRGERLENPKADMPPEDVILPERVIGKAVLFYVGEKAGFALLVSSKRSIHRGDIVRLD
ncbi:hypothetical protein ACQZV8_18580 [Magnetococcales bacterium HHB-1]